MARFAFVLTATASVLPLLSSTARAESKPVQTRAESVRESAAELREGAQKRKVDEKKSVESRTITASTLTPLSLTVPASGASAPALVQLKSQTVPAAVNYATAHYDSQRTGWNPNETLLTPANVNTNNTVAGAHNYNTPTAGFFGEIWNTGQFSSSADVFAVPLYVDSVTMGASTAYSGKTFSVVFAASGNSTVYAIAAAAYVSGTTAIPPGTVLWQSTLGSTSFSWNSVTQGIFNTPVIDLATNTIYVSASGTYTNSSNQTFGPGLMAFALDITTGAVRSGWPVVINDPAVQPVMRNGQSKFFDPNENNTRGALNLSPDGSVLYLPISDLGTGPGFLVSVITTGTPRVGSCFATTKGSTSQAAYYAGIWGADGPSVDAAGNIYVVTGDDPKPSDPFLANKDQADGYWGMTLLVFNPTSSASPALTLKGTYNPWNYQSMDFNDVDMASTPVLLPTLPGSYPDTCVFGAKNGNLYFVNRATLQNSGASFVNHRPSAVNSVFLSYADETGFVDPAGYPYYTNINVNNPSPGATPSGSTGPINVFGPYSEDGQMTNSAKSRTSACVFQGPDNNYYMVFTGQTKTVAGGTTSKPPGVARVKVNAFTNGSKPYLSLTSNVTAGDYYDTLDNIQNAMSPIVSSNGNQNSIAWVMDENASRTASLPGTHPYLVALDAMTMTPLYKSAFKKGGGGPSTLHQGGKYNEVSVARGKVFVGTERLQVFGVTSYVYAVGCGGPGGAGNTTTSLSPSLSGGSNNVITTTLGKTFTADTTSGTNINTASSIDVTGVSNPAPLTVYRNARAGAFTYTFPSLTPGATYSVRLHFSEIDPTVTANGARTFNVSINGTTVLTNYDIYKTCGGRNVADVETFAAVADPAAGTVTVALSAGSASVPIINGIEINAVPNSVAQENLLDWAAQNSVLPALTTSVGSDGVSNLWKYLTNANPNAAGNSAALLPQKSVFQSGGQSYIRFTYLRRIDYATRGITIDLQTSTNLTGGAWTSQAYSTISTTPTGDGVTETAVIQATTPISTIQGSATGLFTRVQMSTN